MANASLKYSVKVGRTAVHIEAEGFKKLFLLSGFLAAIPNKCGNCGSDDIVLNGTKNQGYEFYGVLCRECKHEFKAGQRKEDGGLFWKPDDGWVPPYKSGGGGGGGNREREQPKGGGRPAEDFDDSDDIPF
jgi:hypothetical protein